MLTVSRMPKGGSGMPIGGVHCEASVTTPSVLNVCNGPPIWALESAIVLWYEATINTAAPKPTTIIVSSIIDEESRNGAFIIYVYMISE